MLLNALLVAFGVMVVVWTPLALLAFPSPRKRRMTVRAMMALIGILAVTISILARRHDVPPFLVLTAVLNLYSLPMVLAALYAPPRMDRGLIVAWLMILLLALTILPFFSTAREVH